MKKPYKKAEIEIYQFDTEDVITTSGEGINDNEEINAVEDD